MDALSSLAASPDALVAMGEAARKMARPDAAVRLVDSFAALIGRREEQAA